MGRQTEESIMMHTEQLGSTQSYRQLYHENLNQLVPQGGPQ